MPELTGPEFRELMHEAAQTEFDDMDLERADMARQLGLLFAHNQEFAEWSHLIDKIAITPVGAPGDSPQVTMRIVTRGSVFTFETTKEGKLVQTAYREKGK